MAGVPSDLSPAVPPCIAREKAGAAPNNESCDPSHVRVLAAPRDAAHGAVTVPVVDGRAPPQVPAFTHEDMPPTRARARGEAQIERRKG
jgi:hypothetical protein